ncbi:MAG TPA: LysR family transcriptional regulator [Polyangia bacterium]|nr:LysR family transcriptional regulator [Polyangia bacterium]
MRDKPTAQSAAALDGLRLSDLSIFLAVARSGSLTAAARELAVTASYVSKAIARLEKRLQATLVTRGARGVSLSEAGRRLSPEIAEVVDRLERMRHADRKAQPELTIAASPYLSALFVPAVAEALPDHRVRCLELPAPLLRALAGDSEFDLILSTAIDVLPEKWVKVALGRLELALYAAPAVAASLPPGLLTIADLRDLPFVGLAYWSAGQRIAVDDGCPLSRADRRPGHEAQTIARALDLAARTGQLVFAPALAAREHVASGRLQAVPVENMVVRQPLYLACDGDRVRARVQKAIAVAVRAELEKLA